MSKALSVDLRVRVLAAVATGATHRQAAERFGVSAASVSRWRKREREQGDPRPKALGGDRRSDGSRPIMRPSWPRSDQNGTPPSRRFAASLAEQGLVFGFGTIQRFFARHGITRKKRPRTPASRSAPTS